VCWRSATAATTAGRGSGHRGGELPRVLWRRRRRVRRLRSYPSKTISGLVWAEVLGCCWALVLGCTVVARPGKLLLYFSSFCFFYFLFYIFYLNLIWIQILFAGFLLC
jgi:hypothetical protein